MHYLILRVLDEQFISFNRCDDLCRGLDVSDSERRRFYPAKPHVLRLIRPRTQEQLLTAHDKHSAELLSVDREYQARISGHAAENESLAAKLAAVQVCRAQRLVLLVGLPWRSQHRGVLGAHHWQASEETRTHRARASFKRCGRPTRPYRTSLPPRSVSCTSSASSR
jgi:hypothetical protein